MEYNTDGFKERFEYIKSNNELNQMRKEEEEETLEERIKKVQEISRIEKHKNLRHNNVSLKKKNVVGPMNTTLNNNAVKRLN